MLSPKKILAASILFTLAIPIFFLVAFFIQQQLIQDEMKEQLEFAMLQTIDVKKSGFKWSKNDKASLRGENLFDVKSNIINRNEIIYTGLFDDDENELKEIYSSILHPKEHEPAPIIKLIIKFLLPPPSITNNEAFTTSLNENGTAFFGNYDETLTNRSYKIKTPPPIT